MYEYENTEQARQVKLLQQVSGERLGWLMEIRSVLYSATAEDEDGETLFRLS